MKLIYRKDETCEGYIVGVSVYERRPGRAYTIVRHDNSFHLRKRVFAKQTVQFPH